MTESLRACSINEKETGLKGSSDPVNKLSSSKLLQQRLKTAQLTSSLTQAEKINVKKKKKKKINFTNKALSFAYSVFDVHMVL